MATPKETAKGSGVCCGLLIIIYIIVAIIGAISDNWTSITKNAPGILWGIIFLILIIGILYEGRKAIFDGKDSRGIISSNWYKQLLENLRNSNPESRKKHLRYSIITIITVITISIMITTIVLFPYFSTNNQSNTDKNNIPKTIPITTAQSVSKSIVVQTTNPIQSPTSTLQNIYPGNDVFIGEEGLTLINVTAGTQLYWYTSTANVGRSAPAAIVTVGNPDRFYVAPSQFVEHTGNWYLGNTATVAIVVKLGVRPKVTISYSSSPTPTQYPVHTTTEASSGPATISKYHMNEIAMDQTRKKGMAIVSDNWQGKYFVVPVSLDLSGKGWHTEGHVDPIWTTYANVEQSYPILWYGGRINSAQIPDRDWTDPKWKKGTNIL